MARIRCRHLPLVVVLVDVFVDEAVVEPPMYPVDEAVCEQQECYHCTGNRPPT